MENVWRRVVAGIDHAYPKLLTFSVTIEKAMDSGLVFTHIFTCRKKGE
jgi:hypothetical protein